MVAFKKLVSGFKWPKKSITEPTEESHDVAERYLFYNERSINGASQSQYNLIGPDYAIADPKHGLVEDIPTRNPFKFRPNKLKKKRASQSRSNLLSRDNILLAESRASAVASHDDGFGDWVGQEPQDRDVSDDRLIDALRQQEAPIPLNMRDRVGPGSSLEHFELLHTAGERDTLKTTLRPDAHDRIHPRSSIEQLESAHRVHGKIEAMKTSYNLEPTGWSEDWRRSLGDSYSAASAVREVVAATAAWRGRDADAGPSSESRNAHSPLRESGPDATTRCRTSGTDVGSLRLSSSNPRPSSIYLNPGSDLENLETLGRSSEIRRRPSLFTADDRAVLRSCGLLGSGHQKPVKCDIKGMRAAQSPEAWLDSASSGSVDSPLSRMPGAWLETPNGSVLRKPEAGVDVRRKSVPMERLSRIAGPDGIEFNGFGPEAVSWAKSLDFELEGKTILGPPGCNRGRTPWSWGDGKGKGKGKATQWDLAEDRWREARDSMFPSLEDFGKADDAANKGYETQSAPSQDTPSNQQKSNIPTLQISSPNVPTCSPSTLRQLHSDERLARALSAEPVPATAPLNRDCLVCGDSLPPLSFPAKPPTKTCQHPPNTCTPCLQTWLQTEIATKAPQQLKCPECPSKLSHPEVQRAATPASFTRYDSQSAKLALSDLAGFAWCLSPGCGSGQINFSATDSDNGGGVAAFMECANCRYRQCLQCRVPWHDRESCQQYLHRVSGGKAREDELKTVRMLDSVSKVCPGVGCGWRIQKVSGCDHMRCRHCSHEFCWQCLASHHEIKRVGNTAHEPSCKFHSRNLDIAWPFNVHANATRAAVR